MIRRRFDLDRLIKSLPQLGASLLFHVLVVAILATFYVELPSGARRVQVVSDLSRLDDPEDFPEELMPDEEIVLDAPVSLTTPGGSLAAATVTNPLESAAQMEAAHASLSDRKLLRPIANPAGDLSLDSLVKGLKGTSSVAVGGDDGVIDRITTEILRQLEKNRLIVAWILDSSASLDERREVIARRIDRIYHELSELGVNEHDGILTSIVSVGQTTRFLTDRPTNSFDEVRRAIRDVRDDKTGNENLFTAVRDTALRLRRFQTSGRRSLMVIVLTDEIGDDRQVADDTVALLRRNGVPVYAMGPVASFARPIIHDVWQDPESKFRVWIPVQRGPFTRREEVLHVPFQYGAYLSGFGPFGLTQLTRETGGMYFLYDDQRVENRATYDVDILTRYKANYGSAADAQSETQASDFRKVIAEVADEGNNESIFQYFHYHRYHWIHAQEFRQEFDDRQRDVARWLVFAHRAIARMEGVADQYDQEPDLRWRANFDLNFARLLQAKVRCDQYNWSCAEFRRNPLTLQDPKTNNGWTIRFIPQIRGDKGSTDQATAQKILEKSLFHYQRLLSEHSGTPWAECARVEMSRDVGVDWVEGFDRDFAATDEEREMLRRAIEKAPKR